MICSELLTDLNVNLIMIIMTQRLFSRGKLLLIFFLLPLCTILTNEAFCAQNIKIEIPQVIYAYGNSFTLGQIARISGGNSRTRGILSALNLHAQGNSLLRNEVLQAISNSDASDARIELHMPSESRIEAPGYEGNFTDINSTTQNNSRSASELIPLIKSLSAWNGELQVSASSPVPDGRLIDPASIIPGTSAVTLRFRDNSGNVRSLSVRLTWTQNVMFARRNIRKGDRINVQDLVSRPMKITRPGAYAENPNQIAGFTADRNIKQGEAILLSNVTSSNVVRKGRRVKIIARYGAVTATADGITLEDGRPGEWVKVRRADDRHITLRGRIVNENLVEVQAD